MGITKVINCPACGSENVEKEVWRSPFRYYARHVEETMEKWGVNCVRKFSCKDCGISWRG